MKERGIQLQKCSQLFTLYTTIHTIHTVFLQERNMKSDIEHIPCEIIKSSFIFLTIFLQERNSKKSEARCFPLSSMFFTFIHYLQHRLYSLHILTNFKSKRKNEARCFLFVSMQNLIFLQSSQQHSLIFL